MFWTQLMFCGFNVATQAALLIRQRFLDRPDEPAGYLICLKRVFKATYILNIIDIFFPVGVIFVLSDITSDSSCSLRWTYYINCGAAIVYMTMLAIAVHRIFHETIIAGIQWQVKRTPSNSNSNRRYKNRRRHFFMVMLQMVPGAVWNAFAAGYVQIMTADMPTSQRDLAIFAISSIVLKLGAQELVKMVTMKRKVKGISTMLLVVAVPTVLIDT